MKSDNFIISCVFELVPMKWSLSASVVLLCIKGLNRCVSLLLSTCQSSQINHSVQMGFSSCLNLRHYNIHLNYVYELFKNR